MSKLNFGTKLNAEVKELEIGQTFIGLFQGQSERNWTDKKTGETKVIKQYHFKEMNEDGAIVAPVILFADSGMQSACNSALLKDGDIIKLVKGDKTDLGGGRSMNTYEVFKAE